MTVDAKAMHDKIAVAEKAMRKKWFMEALKVIRKLHPANKFTGEDIRHIVTKRLGKPHHPNVWGALIRKAFNEGYLMYTREYRPMRDPQAHGRSTPVYKVM